MKDEQWTEMVVYLSRKLGWTLEAIGKLSLKQFGGLYNELIYQESVEIWERQYQFAILLAAIYNTIPRGRGAKTFEAKDFYSVPRPVRLGEDKKLMTEVDKKAIEMGIELPKE